MTAWVIGSLITIRYNVPIIGMALANIICRYLLYLI